MNRSIAAATTVVVLGLSGLAPAQAHHSFSAEFDLKSPVVLNGKLKRLEWVNPHSWIYVDVKDAKGQVATWAVEGGAPNVLLRRGLRASDFPPGADIIVKGYRAKNGSNSANAVSITFPDGRNFFMGSSAPGTPR